MRCKRVSACVAFLFLHFSRSTVRPDAGIPCASQVADTAATITAAVRAASPDVVVITAKGCDNAACNNTKNFTAAIEAADGADVAVLVMGTTSVCYGLVSWVSFRRFRCRPCLSRSFVCLNLQLRMSFYPYVSSRPIVIVVTTIAMTMVRSQVWIRPWRRRGTIVRRCHAMGWTPACSACPAASTIWLLRLRRRAPRRLVSLPPPHPLHAVIPTTFVSAFHLCTLELAVSWFHWVLVS